MEEFINKKYFESTIINLKNSIESGFENIKKIFTNELKNYNIKNETIFCKKIEINLEDYDLDINNFINQIYSTNDTKLIKFITQEQIRKHFIKLNTKLGDFFINSVEQTEFYDCVSFVRLTNNYLELIERYPEKELTDSNETYELKCNTFLNSNLQSIHQELHIIYDKGNEKVFYYFYSNPYVNMKFFLEKINKILEIINNIK